jgi:ABC-type lipoprotein release transport system permease subunit
MRNLVVRKTTTIMTALGIALTVAVLVAVLALVDGLQTALQVSGNPLNVMIMRKGATAELSSVVTRAAFNDIRNLPGIAHASDGHAVASIEMVTVINLPSVENPDGTNLTVRGVTPVAREVREQLKLAEGRWFREGQREVVVGKNVAARYPAAQLGKKLKFGKGEWEVVGIMDAGSGTADSEIFCDLNQAAGDFNRFEAPSSVIVRVPDTVTAEALVNNVNDDRRLNASAMNEVDYMQQQTSSAAAIQYLGVVVAIIMAVGSSFAAMNTMYAAVARRAREVGTLRVLGFPQGSILISFFLESMILSLIGAVLGCILVLPLNGLTTGILSQTSFSEVAFHFRTGPQALGIGVAFGLIMGAIGGLLPAQMAARKEILDALRDL